MKRLGIVLALVLGSVGSTACTATADEDVENEEVKKSEEALRCNPYSDGGCVTLERYCGRTGRTMYCTLGGSCWCA